MPGDQLKRLLSRDDSAVVVACLERWMKAGEVTSTYEVSLFVGIARATLGRWLKGGVRIPFGSAVRLLEGLVEYEKGGPEPERALADLTALLRRPPTSHERLFAAFRVNGVRFRKTMTAIAAAGFRIVPIDIVEATTADKGSPQSS